MRLPNGFGSVSKMGGKRRRPWRARKTCGYVDAGDHATQKYITVGYFATKKEALEALAAVSEIDYVVAPHEKTFIDVYKEVERKRAESGKDTANWRSWVKHLAPLYDRPIAKLTAGEIEKVITGTGTQSGAGKLKTILNQTYKHALKCGYVSTSPMQYVDASGPDEEKHIARHVFTPEEISSLFASSGIWRDVILFGILTGMRPSEILEIKTENVHLDGAPHVIGGKKTKAGTMRVVPVRSDLLPIVLKNLERAESLGAETLFCGDGGRSIAYIEYYNAFKKIYPEYAPHDTRHTFATYAARFIPPAPLKKILGHVIADVTESVYIHRSAADLVEDVNKIRFM